MSPSEHPETGHGARLDSIEATLADLASRLEAVERRLGEAGAPARATEAAPRRRAPAPARARVRAPSRRSERPGRRAGPRPGPELERRIGGQVFAVAGALIAIVGLGLLAKVAVDSGWFALVSPGVRCVGIAAAGLVCLALGEALRGRVHAIGVAGLNAVGLAGLYIAAYAAFAVFGLIGAPVAFACMAGASALGAGVAWRHAALSTAALSLVGAFFVPVLLADPKAPALTLPVYLLVLTGASLGLAAGRPRPFASLGWLAWLGTGLLGLVWTFDRGDSHPWAALAFWGAAWGLHQAETLMGARRRDRAFAGEPGAPRLSRREAGPVVRSFLTSAGAVLMGAMVLEEFTSVPSWLAPGAGFSATALLALTFGGHLRVLRDRPATGIDRLAAGLACQAGGLLIATVALALSGWVEVVSWLAMGLGAVVAGRWVGARALEVYGLGLLGLATARLLLYDLSIGAAGVPWTTGAGVALAPWTLLMLGCAAAWLASARLATHTPVGPDDVAGPAPSRRRVRLGVGCAAVGVFALACAPAHPQSSPEAICLVWLVLSMAVSAGRRVLPAAGLVVHGAVLGALATAPWVAFGLADGWLDDRGATVGLHPGLWLGLSVAGVTVFHAIRAARRVGVRGTEFGAALAGLAGLVALGATTAEVARGAAVLADDQTAQRAAVSIWWGLWGVGLVAGGFARRCAPVRHAGLALLGLAAVKAVVLDLAGVPPLWRVASFVGLGGLMLGVALLYGRIGREHRPGGKSAVVSEDSGDGAR
jgi:uncharacterized membrane protein